MRLPVAQDNSPEAMAKLPIVGRKPTSEKEEAFLREIIEVEFLNREEPGIAHSFTYGNSQRKHKFVFLHGGKYRVPRFIAQHVDTRQTPIYKWRPDGSGVMVKTLMGYDPRFQMRQVFA